MSLVVISRVLYYFLWIFYIYYLMMGLMLKTGKIGAIKKQRAYYQKIQALTVQI